MMKSKRQERATCWQKVRYLNLVEANYAANIHTKRFGKKFWPYRCKVCAKWHLTTHDYESNTIIGDIKKPVNEGAEIELTEKDFIEVELIKKD